MTRPATPDDHIADLARSKRAPGRFVTAGISFTMADNNEGWTAFLAWGPVATADDPSTFEGAGTGTGATATDAVIDLRRDLAKR